MPKLDALLKTLYDNPTLSSSLDWKSLSTYFDLVNILRPKLSATRPSFQTGAPATLPVNMHEFFKRCFSFSDEAGKLVWETLRDFAWNNPFQGDEEKAAVLKHMKLFLDYGIPLKIGVVNLESPTRVCIDSRCANQLRSNPFAMRDRELVEPLDHSITVFTRDHGAVPGFVTSRYCRKCNTRYYPNYYVHKEASVRTYYGTQPKFIEISQRYYIEASLSELFTVMMVSSWTSATNCARIYNEGLKDDSLTALLPADWTLSFRLEVEGVWNAFFFHALILDHLEQNTILELPHQAPSQAKRLQAALRLRNHRMVGPGQEAWNHACNLCCHITEDENGKYSQIRSTVTDGITIGRPCCAVHDCKQPLPTVKHRYCNEHRSRDKVCAVEKCEAQAEPGFKTCAIQDHREVETSYREQGKAMFQLKKRLERLKVSQTHDSVSNISTKRVNTGDGDDDPGMLEGVGAEDEDVLVDKNGVCDGKPEAGNRSVKARFGRRRTHNEQLCVGSCGVILGRATFYGSEAPNGVRTFWKALFPTPASLPSVLWHDNNCRVMAMLRKDGDDYFSKCALPVDVFHFKSKHKETDLDCGANCNPYLWRELRTADGKSWQFNSSAAEQTNGWFGGYQAIVREMQADRYDFFLDEMIKRRNRIMIKELRRKGHAPYSIPRDILK